MKRFSKLLLIVILAFGLLVPQTVFAVSDLQGASGKQDYLVQFEGEAIQQGLLQAFGVKDGDILHTFSLIPVVTLSLTEQQAKGLANHPGIKAVEKDEEVQALQWYPWGVSYVQAPFAHAHGITGTGVKIAVLDTGIDSTHQDLSATVSTIGHSVFTDSANSNPLVDGNGHGTHIAGIIGAAKNSHMIIGVAPGAQLYSVKVLTNAGSGTFSGIAQGVEWAVINGMDIINMSLAGSTHSSILEAMVNIAYNNGILIVAAAGSSGNNQVGYPARYNTVIAVGAHNQSGNIASFSATGPNVDLYAPGVSIYSTIPGNSYASYNGTSMAAAHISGMAALYKHNNPSLTNHQLRLLLIIYNGSYQ